MRDLSGRLVPERLEKILRTRASFRHWQIAYRDRFERLGALLEKHPEATCQIDYHWLISQLEKIETYVMENAPNRLCELCDERGEILVTCICRGKGWVTGIEQELLLEHKAQTAVADGRARDVFRGYVASRYSQPIPRRVRPSPRPQNRQEVYDSDLEGEGDDP